MSDAPGRIAASLSVLGDLLIIGTTTLAASKKRRQFTAGILRAMSIADLITSLAMVFNAPLLHQRGGILCGAVAVLMWYGAWASWLWSAGYAYTLWRCLLESLAVRNGPGFRHVKPFARRRCIP